MDDIGYGRSGVTSDNETNRNRILVVKIQRRLNKPLPTFKKFLFHCYFINSSPKSIMRSKPKTSKKEYSDEIVEIILALCEAGKSYAQIADQVKVPRPSVVHIIHRATRTQNEPYRPTKQAGCPPKLDTRARRASICHVERNPYDNLVTLGTPSKLGTNLSQKPIRAYLKTAGYLRFTAQKKLHLTKKYKEAKLHWEREHLRWTLED